MRDHTKRRNYSPEAEQFRREHAIRRVWGLEQRHARKMRRLYGSTTAAWAAFHDRVEELRSPVCSASTDEAGPAARAGSDVVTETLSASPIPVLPETALPETARPAPARPVAIPLETARPETTPPAATRPATTPPATTRPETTPPAAAKPATTPPATTRPTPARPEAIPPGTALPGTVLPGTVLPAPARPETIPPGTALSETARPAATTSAQVEYIPVGCAASVSEVLTPEAILAEATTADPSRPQPNQSCTSQAHPSTQARPRAQRGPAQRDPAQRDPAQRDPAATRSTDNRSIDNTLRTARRPTRHGRSPPGPASRCPAGGKTLPHPAGSPRTNRAQQRGPCRRKQPPSVSIELPNPNGKNLQESARKQSTASNISAARGNTCRRGKLLRT
jgi:hypothetical protein